MSGLKVAIMGGAAKEHSGLMQLGREWELWGLNSCMPDWFGPKYRRIDKWFHLHQRAALERQIPKHVEWFEQWYERHSEIEFVLLELWDKCPNATIFPKHSITHLGPRGEYHCGSFDLMLAYALLLGATEVFIAGVKLHTESSEPMSAGACLEYWIGYAEGQEVKVTVAGDCDLFYNYRLVRDHRMYGYDEFDLVETVK